MAKEQWVLEFSRSQKCFHVDPLEKSIKSNHEFAMRYFAGKSKSEVHDYIPIFVGTEDEVYKFSEAFRGVIKERYSQHEYFGTLEGMVREIAIVELREKAATN